MNKKQKTPAPLPLSTSQANVWAAVGLIVISALFLTSAIKLWGDVSPIRAQNQKAPEHNTVAGPDPVVQYLASLTFMQTETFTPKVVLRNLDVNTDKPALLVSGSVTVGSGNKNVATSFIWGGIGNEAQTTNAVIVGGKGNKTLPASTNPVILGGSGNKIEAGSHGLIAGGEGNTVGGGTAATLILGGKNNKANGGVILGMSNNEIIGNHDSNIVAGNNIKIGPNVSDTFVWSDASSFALSSPLQSNAFYMNTQGGVGINTNNPQVIFDSYGPVKFGETAAADNVKCNTTSNVGLIRYKDGYLCACTQKGYRTTLSDDYGTGVEICNRDNDCKYDPATNTFYPPANCNGVPPPPPCLPPKQVIEGICQEVSFACYAGTFDTTSHAQFCTGSDTGLTTHTENRLYTSCGTNKCAYTCNTGYIIKNKKCELAVCTNKPTENADPCHAETEKDLTADIPAQLVLATACNPANKCEFKCKEGFVIKDGKCVPAACQPPIPENATLCTGAGAGLSWDVKAQLVETCTPANKCEYICKDGFVLEDGECKVKEGCEVNEDCDMNNDEICYGYVPKTDDTKEQMGKCVNKYINPAIFYIQPNTPRTKDKYPGLDQDTWSEVGYYENTRDHAIWFGNTYFPVPSEWTTEDVIQAIKLKPGFNMTTEDALAAFNELCPGGMLDRTIIDSMSVNATGGFLNPEACVLVSLGYDYYGGTAQCATLDKDNKRKIMTGEETRVAGLAMGYDDTPKHTYTISRISDLWLTNNWALFFSGVLNYRLHFQRSLNNGTTKLLQTAINFMVDDCMKVCTANNPAGEEACKDGCKATYGLRDEGFATNSIDTKANNEIYVWNAGRVCDGGSEHPSCAFAWLPKREPDWTSSYFLNASRVRVLNKNACWCSDEWEMMDRYACHNANHIGRSKQNYPTLKNADIKERWNKDKTTDPQITSNTTPVIPGRIRNDLPRIWS